MKICYVCDDYPPYPQGGIGTMTRLFAQRLHGRGHDVRIIGIYPPEAGLDGFARDGDVGVWRLFEPRRTGGWAVARYRLFRQIAEWASKGEIDIVEVPDHRGWGAYWQGLKVPMVVRLHGSGTFISHELSRPMHRIDRMLEKASLRRADRVCSVSTFVAERSKEIFGLPSLDPVVLHNPVDIPAEAVPFDERPAQRVVYVGSLAQMKGVLSLVDAWPAIAAGYPGAELHLFGKDTVLPSGEAMSTHLMGRIPGALLNTVSIHGHCTRERVFKELAASRVAVFPSYVEAFAFAPMEAMASGCATVYSRRGSGPELIRHQETGVLIDPDDPREIADAVLQLLRDPAKARRIADAGRRSMLASFSLDATLAKNERFYEETISRFGARHA